MLVVLQAKLEELSLQDPCSLLQHGVGNLEQTIGVGLHHGDEDAAAVQRRIVRGFKEGDDLGSIDVHHPIFPYPHHIPGGPHPQEMAEMAIACVCSSLINKQGGGETGAGFIKSCRANVRRQQRAPTEQAQDFQ